MGTDPNHFPRPALPSERDTLDFVLSYDDFAGRDALLTQVSAVVVTGACASVKPGVPPGLPAATGPGLSSPIQN